MTLEFSMQPDPRAASEANDRTFVSGRRSLSLVLAGLALTGVLCACGDGPDVSSMGGGTVAPTEPSPARRRVLFVNSYHRGFAWSDGITEAAMTALGATLAADGSIDDRRGDFALDLVYMDTKRNTDEAFKQRAAAEVVARIEAWRPDVVITSDDNAAKYLVAAHYRGKELPFVFCGVDADPADYGFPCANVTGICESEPLDVAVDVARPHAAGSRLGYLAQDVLTARQNLSSFTERLGCSIEPRFVDTFAAWRAAFEALQGEVDVLILGNVTGMSDLDRDEAAAFAVEHTRVPTCSVSRAMAPCALVTVTTLAEEQGEWVVAAARRILAGEAPGSIPLAVSKRGGMALNMRIAKRLGVRFPLAVLDRATLVGSEED